MPVRLASLAHGRLRIAGTIAVSALVALAALSSARKDPPVVLPPLRASLPPSYVRLASLSFDGLVADLLWIRFLSQLPMRPADDSLGRSLAGQLQSVVALDPDFRVAHLQGSILLSVLGDQQCVALDIAELGARRFPADWRLNFQAGYLCLAELGDSACAGRHMRLASANPDSPRWLPGLVGRLLAEASQEDAAIEYLGVQAANEKDPRVRQHIIERMHEAELTRELNRLDAAIRAFRIEQGVVPPGWEAMVLQGNLPAVPGPDPFGGRFEIGHDGRAFSTSGRTSLRTFRHTDGLRGTTRERIMEERVIGRLPAVLGKDPHVVGIEDTLRAHAGDPPASLQALEWLGELEPERRESIRLLQARVILRSELESMRAAYLRLLQQRPERLSMHDVAAEAGVLPHDAFGDRYVFDQDGLPSPAAGRTPISLIRGAGAKGSTACP